MLARLHRVYAWANLRLSEDGGDAVRQAEAALAAAVYARVDAAMKFVNNEILDLPEGTVARCLNDEPLLQVHRIELDDLMAMKPHMLSGETERVLASLGEVLDAPYMIYDRAKMGDMRFGPFTAAGTAMPNSFNLFESSYEIAPQVESTILQP